MGYRIFPPKIAELSNQSMKKARVIYGQKKKMVYVE